MCVRSSQISAGFVKPTVLWVSVYVPGRQHKLFNRVIILNGLEHLSPVRSGALSRLDIFI
jgi:hypothetical protein